MEINEKKRGRKAVSLEDRLYPYLNKTSTCWMWTRSTNHFGYGQITNEHGKTELVHRVMYRLHKGAIPDRASILHTCDQPACCNPDHLKVGSSKQNMEDKVLKGRDHGTRGMNHWKSTLSDEQVEAIRNDTRRQRVIAEEYGVSQPHISIIKKMKMRKVLGVKQEPKQLELQLTF